MSAPIPAHAAGARHAIDIRAGPLGAALVALAQQTGVPLVFDPQSVQPYRIVRLRGTMTVDAALNALLHGSGLAYRAGAGGAILIFRPPVLRAPPPEPPPAPVPEILVVGRRSQNFDIPRTANDIQPYQVVGRERVFASGADTPEELLRTEIVGNTQSFSPVQDPLNQNAIPRSEVNLRGLGASQTLVLVDGVRMPSLPGNSLNFLQPDLNAVPLSAIDRIEVLTSTASGIYGSGALGGVVNLVVRHDYRGVDLFVSGGASDRADAANGRIESRLGFTPDKGRTNVSLYFSRTGGTPLRAADRDFGSLSRQRIVANAPSSLLTGNTPIDGVLVLSAAGNLTLKPGYGGVGLGAPASWLPVGFSGQAGKLADTLAAKGGTLPTTLPADASGGRRSLLSRPSTGAVLFNLRHTFGPGVEAYLDLLRLDNRGWATIAPIASPVGFMLPSSPSNPFVQPVRVLFPLPGYDTVIEGRATVTRISAGAIVDLSRDWRAVANLSTGGARQRVTLRGSTLASASILDLLLGGGSAPLMPLGDWAEFLSALERYRLPVTEAFTRRNRFHAETLKLAGPVMRLSGGPLLLSLQIENRGDHVPTATSHSLNFPSPGATSTPLPELRQQATSLYAELRAPLLPTETRPRWLAGLEFQLALRLDHIREDSDIVRADSAGDIRAPFHTVSAYTAGLRFTPLPRLMLRASVATGTAMPPLEDLASFALHYDGSLGAGDPRRGGRPVGSEAPLSVIYNGSPAFPPQFARSLSVGLVFNPEARRGPRVSLDYTHIAERDIVSDFHRNDIAYFLVNEAGFPGRIERAPLSPGDAALGFTGGVVTRIDASALNLGRGRVDTVDARFDQTVPLGDAGTLALDATASWQPHLLTRAAPGEPWLEQAGYRNGPLRWRARGGATWTRGRLALNVEGQFYASYSLASDSGPILADDLSRIAQQGASRIPAQIYVNGGIAYRLTLAPRSSGTREIVLRLTAQNILGHSPPVVASLTGPGYSTYGDPRERRFQMSAAVHF